MTRVPGHGLRFEGRIMGYHGLGTGPGKARCECGGESPTLPTTAARQRWHKEHKAEVLARIKAIQQRAADRQPMGWF